jgi:hypothetical protein
MSDIDLITIKPIEWDFKRFRCFRYLRIKICPDVGKEKIEESLKESKIKNVNIESNPDHWITWHRKDRPLIHIDLLEQCLKTPKTMLEEFDLEDIEHQASIILRILKRFHMATFLRKRVCFLPSTIGYDEEERQQYVELIQRGIKRRLEIYGYAPIANRKTTRKRINEKKNLAALKRNETAEPRKQGSEHELQVEHLVLAATNPNCVSERS